MIGSGSTGPDGQRARRLRFGAFTLGPGRMTLPEGAATIAVEIIGPIPGTVMTLTQFSSVR
ncbi:MAG: hypothetical protein AAFR53_06825, partial [Pseudomonadota bacterium]